MAAERTNLAVEMGVQDLALGSVKGASEEKPSQTERERLEQLAFLMSLDHEIADILSQHKESKVVPFQGEVRDVNFSGLDRVFERMEKASSQEEMEEMLITYLKKEQGLNDEQVDEVLVKAFSIFRAYFAVFGSDLLDIHGKILETGVIGLQVDQEAMLAVQRALDKLKTEMDKALTTHMHGEGPKTMMTTMWISFGTMAAGMLLGGIGGAALKAAGKISKLGFKVAIGTGTVVSGGLGTGLTMAFGKFDKGISQGQQALNTIEQSLLSHRGQVVSQQISTKNTTEVGKSSQDTNNLMPLLNATLRTMQEVYKI